MKTSFGYSDIRVIINKMASSDEEPSPDLRTMKSDDLKEPLSPTLPWDRFQNWVHCICVVTFDLELGQAMEV